MKKLVFLLLTLVLLLPFPISAGWIDEGVPESFQAAEDGDVNATAHVANVNTNSYSDLVRRILGPVPGITVTSMDSPLAKKMLAQSAIYNLSSYITAMYLNPPASTYAFIQDMGQTLGFMPKKTYAQGVGFSGLSALLPIWKVFRNMAYFLLAIVMVVIGFMVMFRKKIDPKTVVTVQNALPRIVIALLLITFSYAIVGLMIDIMYVLIAIIGGIFKSAGLININQTQALNGQLLGSINNIKPFEIIFRLFGISDPAVMAEWAAGMTVGGIIATVLAPELGLTLGLIPLIIGASSLLIGALIAIAMLLLYLRLFIFFVSTYIKIIIALIFAPFQLLVEAIPGSKAFDGWIRNLAANILVFPAAVVMFALAAVFYNYSNTTTPLWAPPFAGFLNNTTSIGTVVALGILFAIPSIGKQLTELFKSKSTLQGGIGEIGGMLGAPAQIGMQLYSMAASKQQSKDLQAAITKAMGGTPAGKGKKND